MTADRCAVDLRERPRVWVPQRSSLGTLGLQVEAYEVLMGSLLAIEWAP